MTHYKEYDKKYIGSSDIASLTLRFPGGVSVLNFGEDGSYTAYVVDGKAELGEHYKQVLQAKYWLKIYDDTDLVRELDGDTITIYRAGDFGCIIQII